MPDPKNIDYHEHDPLPEDKFPHISNVASANECTGLMPSAPADHAQLEAYRELYSMEIPQHGGPQVPVPHHSPKPH